MQSSKEDKRGATSVKSYTPHLAQEVFFVLLPIIIMEQKEHKITPAREINPTCKLGGALTERQCANFNERVFSLIVDVSPNGKPLMNTVDYIKISRHSNVTDPTAAGVEDARTGTMIRIATAIKGASYEEWVSDSEIGRIEEIEDAAVARIANEKYSKPVKPSA